jgi:hypothetical protein
LDDMDEQEEEPEQEDLVRDNNDDSKHRRHFKSSCSFVGSTATRQEPHYFLATKSRCLSYGFQIDNRCVAL